MSLVHFNDDPDWEIASCSYLQRVSTKPEGLWFSDEAAEQSWSRWCATDAPGRLGSVAHRLELDRSRILCLRTEAELLDFDRAYRAAILPGLSLLGGIDWPAVARGCAGVEISPYQWKLRLDPRLHWYYTWDCASGCVWDLSVITVVR